MKSRERVFLSKELIEDYKNGASVKDLEEKYQISTTTIHKKIPKEIKRKQFAKIDYNQIIYDYQKGKSFEEIAAKYNISKTHAETIIKGNDIKITIRRGRHKKVKK